MVRSIARTMLGGAALATFGLTGCAGTYDLVTSQRFKDRPFHTMFHRDDPMQVLETVEEGDDRVRAMRDVKEPKRSGGSDADQDRLLGILQASATTDPRSLCRLAAVEALARLEDPRVNSILIVAYRNAAFDTPPAAGQPTSPTPVTPAAAFAGVKGAVSSFTPDTVTTIQCHVLTALGKHRSADGLQLLVQVAASKPAARPAVTSAGGFPAVDPTGPSESDRLDVRLAAIRALATYENEPVAIQALIGVLRDERDVALRGRAHESLVSITGQDLEPDAKVWTDWAAQKAK